MPYATDIAWAAGLFEGEGCITFANAKHTQAQMSLTSTDFDVVKKFHKVVRYGTIYSKHRNVNQRPAWIWSLNDLTEMDALFFLFRPYLGLRRRTRFTEVTREVRKSRKLSGFKPKGRYRKKKSPIAP